MKMNSSSKFVLFFPLRVAVWTSPGWNLTPLLVIHTITPTWTKTAQGTSTVCPLIPPHLLQNATCLPPQTAFTLPTFHTLTTFLTPPTLLTPQPPLFLLSPPLHPLLPPLRLHTLLHLQDPHPPYCPPPLLLLLLLQVFRLPLQYQLLLWLHLLTRLHPCELLLPPAHHHVPPSKVAGIPYWGVNCNLRFVPVSNVSTWTAWHYHEWRL